MNYKAQMLDPRWQKKRLSILDRDNFTCTSCGSDKKTLHVHHLYYENGRDYWDYPESALVSLCEDCHTDVTDYDKERKTNFSNPQYERLRRITINFPCISSNWEDYKNYAVELVLVIHLEGQLYIGDGCGVSGVDEINGFDLLEAALYYKIPYKDFRDYCGWCLAVGEVLTMDSYKEAIKDMKECLVVVNG